SGDLRSENAVDALLVQIDDVGTAPPADVEMAHELPACALLPLEEGARHALVGMAFVAGEQIVDIDHCAVLQQRIDEVEYRYRRLVEIAIDVHQRDLPGGIDILALERRRQAFGIKAPHCLYAVHI